jgi:hypothetical protein
MAIPSISGQGKKYEVEIRTVEEAYAVKMEQSVEDAYKARKDMLKDLNAPASVVAASPASVQEEILRILNL